MSMSQLRKVYHEAICREILGYRNGIPSIADGSSKRSVELAEGILSRMGFQGCPLPPSTTLLVRPDV